MYLLLKNLWFSIVMSVFSSGYTLAEAICVKQSKFEKKIPPPQKRGHLRQTVQICLKKSPPLKKHIGVNKKNFR